MMAPNETIKSLLKDAKVAFANKDFEKAINLCKEVLKSDRDNYWALVYLGAAMQETDQKEQAPKAFKKAAALSPDNIVAWQGLSSYYEKYPSDEPNDYLFTVFKKILNLESDNLKWCVALKKLVDFTLKSKQTNEFVECVEEHLSTSIPEKKVVMWPGIVTVLTSAKDLNENEIKLFYDALDIVLGDPVAARKTVLQKLVELKKLDAVIKLAAKTNDIYAKEVACKMFGELSVEDPNVVNLIETDITEWCDSLLALNSSSYSGIIAKAACFMKNLLYPEARDLLETCVGQHNTLWHAHCMLSKAYLQMLCYYDAELSAKAAKKCDPDEKFVKIIDSLLMEAFAHSNDENKWNSCIEICKKLLIEDRTNTLALECMCRTYINLENWDVAKKVLTKLEELSSGNSEVSALLWLKLAELADKTEPPLEILLAITDKHPNSPEAWYQLAMHYLQKDKIQEGISALFKAGRLAPYWYKVYHELGNYFMTHDIEKARCCYKKALYLNKRSSDVGMALSDIYRVQGEAAQNMELLTAITKTTQSKWAWLQLGLQYFELKDINAAVKCFLAAIRIDVQDSYCWEVLGDAYLARMAYTAAQKSYQKVVQLRPDALYPQLQIARINLITGEPEEVVPEFRKLAEEHPQDVPVLEGLAEACLQAAKQFHSKRLIGCARDYLQEALNAVTSALKEWSDVSCLWKLLGDIFIRAGHLPPTWSFMEIPYWFDPRKNQNDKTIAVKGKIEFFKFATLCYSQALKLIEKKENCSLLWQDLAMSYCLQSRMSADNEDKKQLMQKAFAVSKKSVCLNSAGWENWNVLGVIARSPEINEKPLAQHCFIQSILNEEKNAVAWTNLGVLYLELEQKYLANQAFKSAQRIDENYVHCWIGQALLAESENHSETLDLFRHTTQLGFHAESSSGYAEHVLLTMQQDPKTRDSFFYEENIMKMNAVTVACDAMIWYTEEREDDSYGFNMLGCLQEKSGLFSCAANSFNKALELASKQHFNLIRANLGRVYIRMKHYKEAIKILREVTDSDFQTQCNIGLAYFKAGMFKEALMHFDTVLHYYCSDNDSEKKSDILIAKAAILYKNAKSKKDFYDAKTQLLECIVAKPPSVHGLFAAFSFGILQEDLVLSKSVLHELKPMQDMPEYIFHISTFFAYFRFIQGDLKGSVKSLEKSVHRQPWQASLWFGLALLILEKICNSFDSRSQNGLEVQELKESARAAARCAYTSMQIGRNSMDVTKVLPVVSVCHMLSGDMKRSLSVSQHAVHLFPNVAEGWATLVAPALHLSNSGYPVHVASSVLSYVRKNLPLERSLSKWMSNVERKLEIQAAAS